MNLDTIAQSCLNHMWLVSWQFCVLVLIVTIIIKLLPRSTANFRYWLWCIILFRLCLPGDLFQTEYYIIPNNLSIDKLWKQNNKQDLLVNNGEQTLPVGEQTLPVGDKKPSRNDEIKNTNVPDISNYNTVLRKKDTFISVTTQIALLWCFCVFFLLAILVLRAVYAFAQIRLYPRICDKNLVELTNKWKKILGIEKDVCLLLSPKIQDGPFLTGIFFPKIILPTTIIKFWKENLLSPILLHELAHLKRFDLVVNWLQIIVQIIYFFNPVVWYVNRKIYVERENACDDLAVFYLDGKRKNYTKSMLKIAKENDILTAFGAIGLAEKNHSLKARILRILDNKYIGYKKMKKTSILILAFFAIFSVMIFGQETELNQSEQPEKESIQKVLTTVSFELYDDLNKKRLTPELILLNNEKVNNGASIPVGTYDLLIFVPKYEYLFKKIHIKNSPNFTVKEMLIPISTKTESDPNKLSKVISIDVHIEGDFPKKERIDPEIVSLNNFDVRENVFAPGTYVLKIDNPGYFPIFKKIIIPSNTNTYTIKEVLISKPRKVELKISHDLVSPEKQNDYEVIVSTASTESNQIKLTPNTMIKPGSYNFLLQQKNYESIKTRLHVWPDERPFVIEETLKAKHVSVDFDISFNGTKNPKEQIVFFTDMVSDSNLLIEKGNLIKPGTYTAQAYHPDYGLSEAQAITIEPSDSYTLKMEINKPTRLNRSILVFKMIYNNVIAKPWEILVNGAKISSQSFYDLGDEINVTIKSLNYKTINQKISINTPLMIVAKPLEALQRIEFTLRKKNMELDNVEYSVVFKVDGKIVEKHLVEEEEGIGRHYFTLMIPKESQEIQILNGYMLQTIKLKSLRPGMSVGNFNNIDMPMLIEHLKRQSDEKSIIEITERLFQDYEIITEKLFQDYEIQEILSNSSKEDKNSLITFLQSLSITDTELHSRRQKVIENLK